MSLNSSLQGAAPSTCRSGCIVPDGGELVCGVHVLRHWVLHAAEGAVQHSRETHEP